MKSQYWNTFTDDRFCVFLNILCSAIAIDWFLSVSETPVVHSIVDIWQHLLVA